MEASVPRRSRGGRGPVLAGEQESQRRELLTLAVLFLFLRVLMPFWFTGKHCEFGNYLYHLLRLSSLDAFPFIDYWLEYPPVFPWIALGIYRLDVLLLGREVGPAGFAASAGAFLAIVETLNLLLIFSIAKEIRGHRFAMRCATAYALLLYPMVAMLGYFDGFALLAILTAVWAMIRNNATLAGIATGVGIMTKIVPVLLVFPAIKYVARRHRGEQVEPGPDDDLDTYAVGAGAGPPAWDWNRLVHYFGTMLLTVGALAAPFIPVKAEYILMPLRVMQERPGWETLPALANGRTGFGYVGPMPDYLVAHPEFLGTLENDRNKAQIASLKAAELPEAGKLMMLSRFTDRIDYLDGSGDRYYFAMTAAMLALLLAATLYMPIAPTALNITTMTGVVFLIGFVFSKGWSPQFIVYVLPFALIGLAPRVHVAAAMALTAVTFMEMPVWLHHFCATANPRADALLWVVVTARTLLLAGIAIMLAVRARLAGVAETSAREAGERRLA